MIAWVLLIEGAAWNANVVRTTAPNCYYLKDGIFAGAGVLCLAATALGITSYIMMRTKRVNIAAPQVVPAKLPPAATQGNGPPQNQEEPQLPPADDTVQPAMASSPPQEGVPQQQGSEHPIRRRLIRALIRLAARVGMRVVVHSLCSDSIATPTDILDSMTEPQSTEAV